jgi:hypothetical protein
MARNRSTSRRTGTRNPPARAYVRFTRWRRRRFLALLAESGNARLAAELAGAGIAAVYRLRTKDRAFAAAMDAARKAASARLGPRDAASCGSRKRGHVLLREKVRVPASPESGASRDEREGLVVRRGAGGRLRLMAAGPHVWEPRQDAAFLLHLRGTGNVAASARAIGFTPKAAHDRRRKRPAFAAAWAPALAEARMRLESQLLEEGMLAAGIGYFEAFGPEPPKAKFDAWLALAVLRYWNAKERRLGGGGGSGSGG